MLKHDDDGSAVTIANPKTAEFQVRRRRCPTLHARAFERVTEALNESLRDGRLARWRAHRCCRAC